MFRRISIAAAAALLAPGFNAAAGEQLHDPTRPYAVEAAPAAHTPAFRLSAIFVSSQRRVAIVNGRPVSTGDRIDGATVSRIEARSIHLDYRGRIIKVGLNTTRIRE